MTEVAKLIASLPHDQVYVLEFALRARLDSALIGLAQNMAEVSRGNSPYFANCKAATRLHIQSDIEKADTVVALMDTLGLDTGMGTYSEETLAAARTWIAQTEHAEAA